MPDPIAFTSTSPRQKLPLLFAGQAAKEFTVNEALARIDTLLHPAIEGEDDMPPGSPSEGDTWLVGTSPTSAWAGHPGELACFTLNDWIFIEPRDGMRLLDASTGQLLLRRDSAWTIATPPAAPAGGATVDAEARTAINALIASLADAGIFPAP